MQVCALSSYTHQKPKHVAVGPTGYKPFEPLLLVRRAKCSSPLAFNFFLQAQDRDLVMSCIQSSCRMTPQRTRMHQLRTVSKRRSRSRVVLCSMPEILHPELHKTQTLSPRPCGQPSVGFTFSAERQSPIKP